MQLSKGTDQQIHVSGNITAANAKDFMQELLNLAESRDLQLHLKEVPYISSAGLRVFVQLVQDGYSIHVLDVTQEVYEVLEDTGMPQIMQIDRPLKWVSVAGLEKIGAGASADILRLDDDRIIKVFVPSMPLEFIRNEAERTRQAFLSGIDTMVSYDLVQTERGLGAIYEDLHARDLSHLMREDHSRAPALIEGFGRFVRSMHEKKLDRAKFGSRLDALRMELLETDKLGISLETARKLISVLERAIPDSDHFIHGDCHVGNVMVREDGSFQFIDMGRISCGHIVYDLTSVFMQFRYQSYNGLTGGASSAVAEAFSMEERLDYWKIYFKAVTGIEDEDVFRRAEEQLNVIGGIVLLSGRRYRPDILTEKACAPFIRNALAYEEGGCPPLVF